MFSSVAREKHVRNIDVLPHFTVRNALLNTYLEYIEKKLFSIERFVRY
jgi:hypothetical protein